MSEAEERITDAELEVMGALWRGEGPMTLSQVKEAMARARGWNGDTTKTQRLIDKLYAGSAKAMVAALVERQALKREDVGELRAMFDALWEEKEGGET